MVRKEVIVLPGMKERPYSSAIRAGDFIFVSGTVGGVDAQGNPIEGIAAQTRQCLENMKNVLQTAGASLSDVVKATVFLTNADGYAKMNEVYRSYFPKDLPTRSTVITGLALPELLIEIECIAYKP
jgi:2-iminobutanoate/2-iminopropanoate deaminase